MCRMFFKYFYLIFFRVIGQAANCIERSLGMKFSMESLKVPSLNEEGMLLISHLTFSFFGQFSRVWESIFSCCTVDKTK